VSITTETSIIKRSMAAFAVIGVLLLAACGSSSSSNAITNVDASTFLTTVSQPGVTVVDVRTPEEFAAGHLEGAVNMNVEGPDFSTQIATLDTAGTVALYCQSGRRSAIAADQMASAGFTSIVNLQGGIADLQSAGGNVVN
jgi:phage shock protein E